MLEIFLYFAFYSILGWCMEVIFAFYVHKSFVNRGFLNGPYCPIYGFGAILVILLLKPFWDNVLWLFLGGMIISSVLEYVVGFVLEKSFHAKWWDYSDEKLNLNGRICLKASLGWGIFSVLLCRFIHPILADVVLKILQNTGMWIIYPIMGIYVVDTAITLVSVLSLNTRLGALDRAANELRERLNAIQVSEEFRKKLQSMSISEHFEELKKRYRLDSKIHELKALYDSFAKKKTFGHGRLIKAFPRIKSTKFNDALEFLKNRYTKK
ncbi:MAG: putative ABC transporter permease [Clostridia bacterium]|nr:putative ABC transporter permease [Clostridia bacterium]